MGVIWYKIWYDLWQHKGRTIQVVAIIAMGAFALGMIVGGQGLFVPVLQADWRANSPAMITLGTNPFINTDTLEAFEKIDGVVGVDGAAVVSIEWRLSPADDWSAGELHVREDYPAQKYQKFRLLSGEWPEETRVAVGKENDAAFGLQMGGQVTLRVNDQEYPLDIGGVVYNPIAPPPDFGGSAQFFTTQDQLEKMIGQRGFNRVLVRGERYDVEKLTVIASEIEKKLEKQGVDAFGAAVTTGPPGARLSDPETHFSQDIINGLFFVMTIMAGLALVLGLFLVYNTINAVVTQQVDQIGVMKAIGAQGKNVLQVYLVTVLVYGMLAALVAVPLGALGAYGLSWFMLDAFLIAPGPFDIYRPAVLAQVAVSLLAPLLASVIPISRGAKITVREAISTYGLSTGISWLDRTLAHLENLSRQLLLTVSNTFRHKGRVFLTQVTLVLSGLIFMMVMSVRDSVSYTFGDVLFEILNFNITLAFEEYERIDYVEALTLAQPGIKTVEVWLLDGGKTRPQGQAESDTDEDAAVFGVPLPTDLYNAQVRQGRWLSPGDSYAVVINQQLAVDVGVGLGDWITLDHGVRGESDWVVVGLLFDPLITSSVYVPRDVLMRELGVTGKGQSIWIQTTEDTPTSELAVARALRKMYEEKRIGLIPGGTFGIATDTKSELIDLFLGNFGFIVSLLATMAMLIGLVGSIALSGVLSLNVLERRREIGVMRAVGASSGAVARLFIGEGLLLGWLSWLLAVPLSLPAGRLMAEGLGSAIGFEMIYHYTPMGAAAWLGVITVLSIGASWLPSRTAVKISVRESLAYM